MAAGAPIALRDDASSVQRPPRLTPPVVRTTSLRVCRADYMNT
jgi:hypothetical protein